MIRLCGRDLLRFTFTDVFTAAFTPNEPATRVSVPLALLSTGPRVREQSVSHVGELGLIGSLGACFDAPRDAAPRTAKR